MQANGGLAQCHTAYVHEARFKQWPATLKSHAAKPQINRKDYNVLERGLTTQEYSLPSLHLR